MAHVMLRDWTGAEFALLPHEMVAALPQDDRRRYEERLHGYDLDNENTSHHYRDWCDYRDRCTFEGCKKVKYDRWTHCIDHISIDDVEDPNRQVNRRAQKARLRMAEMLEMAVDELEKIVSAGPDEMAPAVRLKAIDTLFDRANLPRQTAQSVDLSGQVEILTIDAASIIQGRLDRLASSMVDRELTGIAEAEIIED